MADDCPDMRFATRSVHSGTQHIEGGDAAALRFMRSLNLIFEATSLGGVESLVECPFNSSHMFIPEMVRHASGVVPGFVRISIGIEDVEDLWSDIDQALMASATMVLPA